MSGRSGLPQEAGRKFWRVAPGKKRRGPNLLDPRKLAGCKECFDGRKTWMQFADRYFSDYVDYYKEMEEEIRRGYEK